MVHLFGDWFGDIVVIFLCLVIYIFLRINSKEKKAGNRLDFAFSAIIFFISACQVIGSLVLGDLYYGPQEGFVITLLIMLITLGTGVLTAIELRADKK
jgi:amino acid transporter